VLDAGYDAPRIAHLLAVLRRPPWCGEAALRRGQQAGLTVVVAHRRHRNGRRPLLAVLPPPLRHRAHIRLFKQTLGWTRPRLRSPEAAVRWTWLVIAAHAQLRLARPLATDLRRPWEKPTEPNRLTPARVRRGFRNLHVKTGSPAGTPTPSRRGPGRPPGSKNRRLATQHEVGRVLATSEAYPAPHTTRWAPSRDAQHELATQDF
jgi:hypothetical protein